MTTAGARSRRSTSTGATAARRVREAAERRLGPHVHLVRGSIGIMTSTMLAAVTGWLFWVIATHRWPTSQVGVATSLIAALTSIALIAGQPIATTMLLRIPRSPQRAALLTAGVLAAGAIAVVESAVAIAVLPSHLNVVRTVGLGISFTIGSVAAAIALVLDASSVAIRKPSFMVARNGLHGTGKLVLVGVLALPAGFVTAPYAVVESWAALSVLSALVEWRSWHREVARTVDPSGPRPAPGRREGFGELRSGYGLQVVSTLGGALPPQLLPILVVAILSGRSAAWFSITWLVGGLCFMISPAVCQALLAEGSFEPTALDRTTRAAVLLSGGLLAGPLVIYVVAGHWVLGLFGASYATKGTTLLVILAISAIPDLITNVAVARFRVQQRLRDAALVNAVIAVVAIGGAALSLRRHGIDGAGWSWAIGEGAGCAVLLLVVVLHRSRAPRLRADVAPR